MLCYNVESVNRNAFCWTIITSTNVPIIIIIIMCPVNVLILPQGETFMGISECSCYQRGKLILQSACSVIL